MNILPPPPPNIGPDLAKRYATVARTLEKDALQTKIDQRRKLARNSLNLIWMIIIVLGLLIASSVVYSNWEPINGFIAETLHITPKEVVIVPTPLPASADCENLVITTVGTTNNFSGVESGKCYNITGVDQATWTRIFSNPANVDAYANNVSNGQGIPKDYVVNAIINSLTTFVFDLRGNISTTQAPTETQTAAVVNTTTAAPVVTETPALVVTVVPSLDKERPLSLAELALTMISHNITTVSGTNNSSSAQGKAYWMMKYTVDGAGNQDYLVLSILAGFPPGCSAATKITVSMQNTGATNEFATQAGDNQVWIVCS